MAWHGSCLCQASEETQPSPVLFLCRVTLFLFRWGYFNFIIAYMLHFIGFGICVIRCRAVIVQIDYFTTGSLGQAFWLVEDAFQPRWWVPIKHCYRLCPALIAPSTYNASFYAFTISAVYQITFDTELKQAQLLTCTTRCAKNIYNHRSEWDPHPSGDHVLLQGSFDKLQSHN